MRLMWIRFCRPIFFTVSVCVSPFLRAQTSYNASDINLTDGHWIKVLEIPKDKLPQGTAAYFFHATDSGGIDLFAENRKGKLVRVKSWQDQCVFNPGKGDKVAYYRGGGVTLCSELTYKATSVCCSFDFNAVVPEFVGLSVSDEDADFLYTGDSLLLAGDIAGAVNAYGKIAHPSLYMDVVGKGLEIVEAAHPLAVEAYEKGDYGKAASIMKSALSYKGLWILGVDEFETVAALEKYQKETWKFDKSIKELLETYVADYGLFLYKAGRLQESIAINLYLTGLLKDQPDPCLQWADALYDMGKTEPAKQAYRMYLQRMGNLDRMQEVPKRAIQRSE